MCIRKADSVGVRFLFVYAYSVFSSMIGFIYLSAVRFFFLLAPFLSAKAHTAQFTRLLRSKRIGLLYPCAYFVYCRGIQCRISFVSCPAYYATLLCIPPIGNRHRRLLFTRDTIPHVVSILLLAFCARDFNERDSSSISSVFDTDISSYSYLYYPISTYWAAK